MDASIGVSEPNLNVMLAELLAERGLRAAGELTIRRGKGRRAPDVMIVLNGIRVVIEGKMPGAWDKLVEQCERRVDEGDCDLCIMIEYAVLPGLEQQRLTPTQLQVKESLLRARFNVGSISYIDRIRIGLDRWLGISHRPGHAKMEGLDFHDLLRYIMTVYNNVVSEEVLRDVVARVQESLMGFAKSVHVHEADAERLKKVLELREKEGEKGEQEG